MTSQTEHWILPGEIDRYATAVNAFRADEMDGERFMALRLQQGVYGQRQEGVHMVRVKVPGGQLTSTQLLTLAASLDKYSGHPTVAITTRQDIQFHYVPLAQTAPLLTELATAGLTTREACGNTVRNITACSLAGVCPNEVTDVTAYLQQTAAQFLRHPLTQHLPRKFKMSFSGCLSDCAMGFMHDVGVVAILRQGEAGFRLLAGGGLGHKPRKAVVVEEFIPQEQLFAAIEALIALHNRYSDRKKRAKARLKFLVDREELIRTQAALAATPLSVEWQPPPRHNQTIGSGLPRQVLEQKQSGLYVYPVKLPCGAITAAQLRGLAEMMQQEPSLTLRTTADQNMVITHLTAARLAPLDMRLQSLGLGQPQPGDNIVACPGTSTCRLGITSSKTVAAQLTGGTADLRLRISGCHNSCGQHHLGDIGLHGEGQRLHGKLIPSYVVHLGGATQHGGTIALKGPTIPALRITAAVARIEQSFVSQRGAQLPFAQWVVHQGPTFFAELLRDLVEVSPEEATELARDIGEAQSFKVLQLGGGECAGAAQDFVAANFSEALHERNYCAAFHQQRKMDAAIECARHILSLTASSILFLAGIKKP
ncbi:MAG: nitrite and sulfite reductase 4Fe-4S region, partial [Halothiobacillaceae bacterium]